MVDERDVKPPRQRNRFLEYAGSADDKGLVRVLHECQGLFYRSRHQTPFRFVVLLPSNHDIGATGQRPPYGFKRFPAHKHRVPQGYVFEVFEVSGQSPGQTVVFAYHPVPAHRHNDGQIHVN